MAKIYTKTGDAGKTRLGNGASVSKDHRRVSVSGTIDEASSALGIARAFSSGEIADAIMELQTDFVNLMGRISLFNPDARIMPVEEIENKIDKIKEKTSIENVFVYPGDSKSGAGIHVARSVFRRAEREFVALSHEEDVNLEDLKYINRVSDYLYALSIWADYEEKIAQIASAVTEKLQKIGGGGSAVKNNDISTEEAKVILAAMERKATEGKVPMVMAVTDNRGSLVAFLRQDGALPVSSKLAPSKAYTATQIKMSTERLAELVQPGGELYGLQNDPRLVVFGGGIPLTRNGEVVGAVGVSGGSVEEDVAVAQAAFSVWNN